MKMHYFRRLAPFAKWKRKCSPFQKEKLSISSDGFHLIVYYLGLAPMVLYYSILLSFKRICHLENTAGGKEKQTKNPKRNTFNKKKRCVRNGEGWGFYRNYTNLIYQTNIIFRFQWISSYTPSTIHETEVQSCPKYQVSKEAMSFWQKCLVESVTRITSKTSSNWNRSDEKSLFSRFIYKFR